MIVFPNAKINIGLYVTGRRQDGYHDIETVFFPVPLFDALEFVELNDGSGKQVEFTASGISLRDCTPGQNLCVKAYRLVAADFKLPHLHIHLHKNIPSGAGLGGGSADASFMIKALDTAFCLNLSDDTMKAYAAKIGSDCSFFISNKPSVATGRGDVLTRVPVPLWGYFLVIVHPGIHVGTADAYADVKISLPPQPLAELLKKPVNEWNGTVVNEFEKSVFNKYPEIKDLKSTLYQAGAVYVSMSGSGSAVYALFDDEQDIRDLFPENYFIWSGKL